MFLKRFIWGLLIIAAFIVLLVGSAFAQDERINRAPYHFGGDTLFCDQDNGCTLLNLHGQFLYNWPQADISDAFAETDQTEQNALVGDGQGSYGKVSLWAIVGQEENGNKSLCMQGFDEWGKQNDMCFEVTTDYTFEQAPLPVAATPIPEPTACKVASPPRNAGAGPAPKCPI